MKKRKINLKKIIVIAIIIAIAIISVFLIKKVFFSNNENIEVEDLKSDGEFHLDGFNVFAEKYTGQISLKYIRAKFKDIGSKKLNRSYKEYNGFDDEKLRTTFNDTKSAIIKRYGIDNEEDFVNFINKLEKAQNIDLSDTYKIVVDVDSFVNESDKRNYSYVESVLYDRNDNELRIGTYIAQGESMDIWYIFDIIEN